MSANEPSLDPQTGLAPDEAPTPMWLPLLGAALFLLALTWMAVSASDDESSASGDTAAADDSADTAEAQPTE